MSICLTRACNRGSSERALAALLSHRIVVADFGSKPIAASNCLIQIASFAASNAATYSASHDEVATVFCFRAHQETTPDPRLKV